MKLAATLCAILAAALLCVSARLFWLTWAYAHSGQYSPGAFSSLAYRTATIEADGSAIYWPAFLLLALALFLAKFAVNLWRDHLPGKGRKPRDR